MNDADLNDLIIKTAEQFRLDANLLRAFITIESSGNNWKNRFEPSWHYFYNDRVFAEKLCISVPTEQTNQACSWGLMQIMGSVAREQGFTLDLPMLCDPSTGLFFSCKYLRKLMDKFGDEEHVVAAWNGGPGVQKTIGGMWTNQQYVDKIYAELRVLRKIQ